MKIVILVMIGFSSFLSAELSKVSNIVSDSVTALEWQDDAEVGTATYSWEDAITHCEELALDGFENWRLPNVNELKTLVDRSKSQPALIGTTFQFVNYLSDVDFYWSSTSVDEFKNGAWVIGFYSGFIGGNDKVKGKGYTRCVRD